MEARGLRADLRSIRGRTLLEYLIVAVIIGVVTLACVPVIKNMSAKASDGKAMQNARSICELYNGARSVGVVFSSPTKAGIVNELFDGVRSSILADNVFQLPTLEGHDLVEALRYCRYDPVEDVLSYQPAGGEMIEEMLVQAGAGVGVASVVKTNYDGTDADDLPWTRLPTWFSSGREQSQRVLEYIEGNPRMVHLGVEFGENEWRVEQGDDGLWWPEYRQR